jgi:hypothetical protein
MPTPPRPERRCQDEDTIAQAFVENLNHNALTQHWEDVARLPPEVRAQKTEAEWLKVPGPEILKLARVAKK